MVEHTGILRDSRGHKDSTGRRLYHNQSWLHHPPPWFPIRLLDRRGLGMRYTDLRIDGRYGICRRRVLTLHLSFFRPRTLDHSG